jgi:hypothetical protein
VESLRALPEPFGSMVATLTDVCAYAGTGNVLKIQRLLHICSEHYETKEDSKKKVEFFLGTDAFNIFRTTRKAKMIRKTKRRTRRKSISLIFRQNKLLRSSELVLFLWVKILVAK